MSYERQRQTFDELREEPCVRFHEVQATLPHQVVQFVIPVDLVSHGAEEAIAVARHCHNLETVGVQGADVVTVAIGQLLDLPAMLLMCLGLIHGHDRVAAAVTRAVT